MESLRVCDEQRPNSLSPVYGLRWVSVTSMSRHSVTWRYRVTAGHVWRRRLRTDQNSESRDALMTIGPIKRMMTAPAVRNNGKIAFVLAVFAMCSAA